MRAEGHEQAEWMALAACQGYPPEWWDPIPYMPGDNATRARAREEAAHGRLLLAAERCEVCPVRRECARDAVLYEGTGLRGGRMNGTGKDYVAELKAYRQRIKRRDV